MFVTLVRMHEAHFAFAAERSRIVETLAVLAKSRIVGTLVNVLTHVSIAAKTSVAHALKQT